MTTPFTSASFPSDPTVPASAPAGYTTPTTPPSPDVSPPIDAAQLESMRGNILEMVLRQVAQAILGAFVPGTESAFDQIAAWASGIPLLGTIVEALTGLVDGGLNELEAWATGIPSTVVDNVALNPGKFFREAMDVTGLTELWLTISPLLNHLLGWAAVWDDFATFVSGILGVTNNPTGSASGSITHSATKAVANAATPAVNAAASAAAAGAAAVSTVLNTDPSTVTDAVKTAMSSAAPAAANVASNLLAGPAAAVKAVANAADALAPAKGISGEVGSVVENLLGLLSNPSGSSGGSIVSSVIALLTSGGSSKDLLSNISSTLIQAFMDLASGSASAASGDISSRFGDTNLGTLLSEILGLFTNPTGNRSGSIPQTLWDMVWHFINCNGLTGGLFRTGNNVTGLFDNPTGASLGALTGFVTDLVQALFGNGGKGLSQLSTLAQALMTGNFLAIAGDLFNGTFGTIQRIAGDIGGIFSVFASPALPSPAGDSSGHASLFGTLIGFLLSLIGLGGEGNGGLSRVFTDLLNDFLGLFGNPDGLGTGTTTLPPPTGIPIVAPTHNLLLDFFLGFAAFLAGEAPGTSTNGPLNGLFRVFEHIPLVGGLLDLIVGFLDQIPLIGTIMRLLGLVPSSGGTTSGGGTGGSATPPPATTDQAVASFLGLLTSGGQIPASSLKPLAPSTGKNVFTDNSLATGIGIMGQGLWCWDQWMGAIRTIRPGLITVYVAPGTPGGIFTNQFNTETFLKYLQSPATSYLANGYMFTGLDQTHFETIFVPYPDAYPVAASVQQGVNWLTSQINATPGPFILVGSGQGTLVCSGAYDQIRYGSLQSRRNDLLAGVMWGGMRREEGHSWPGGDAPAGTSGAVVDCASVGPYKSPGDPSSPAAGNLIDTEDLWWDLCAPADFLTCCPTSGSATAAVENPAWMSNPIPGQPMSAADAAVIDEIMTLGLAQPGTAPGVTISISGPMGTYTKSYGSGMQNDGYFRMASITKSFTATAILKAVDEGLLSLDDHLETYVPGVPNGENITIRQVMMMTSGVYDYTQDSSFKIANIINPTSTAYTPDVLLGLIKSKPNGFTPGTQYSYTDSNYVLLGYVLMAVYPSGGDAQQIIMDKVVTPLGLTNTTFADQNEFDLPSPSDTGYMPKPLDYLGLSSGIMDGTRINAWGQLYTSGSGISTISDLDKWGKSGLGNSLLSAEMQQERMTTFGEVPQPGYPWNVYGYGLGYEQIGSWFGHDGSWTGFDSACFYEPSTGTVITVVENLQTTSPPGLKALSLYWWNLASYLLPGSTSSPNYSPGAKVAQVSNLNTGVDGEWFRQFFHTAMQSYGGGDISSVAKTVEKANPKSTVVTAQMTQALALEKFYLNDTASPQSGYFYEQPFLSQGDGRSYVQIGLDYISQFAGGFRPDGTPIMAPPANGVRHQIIPGQRIAAQPGDVVVAGASFMWTNVECSGPAFSVCVNAYDASNNLIAEISYIGATISDPALSSNWEYVPVQADFLMPEGTAEACLMIDIEPAAMTTGTVWVNGFLFEQTNLVDGALLNVATLEKITGEQVSGPQATANLATFLQNFIDGLASAGDNTNYQGTQLEQAIQAAAQTSYRSSLAYTLGVQNNTILSNVSNQPLQNGMQQAGQSTINLPKGSTLPFSGISSGSSMIGFINSTRNVDVGFIEFEAKGAGGSGVYVNVYSVDNTAGTLTQLWSSSDISSQVLNGSWGWVSITIPTADRFHVSIGDIIALEIVSTSSGLNVVSDTWGHASNPSWALPNIGASRVTASTGGSSPASLTASQITFSGTAPYLCMGVSDLPPTYMPPAQSKFESPGIQPYPIPDFAQVTGATFSIACCGAGGAAGDADGTFFAGRYLSGGDGQGATGGQWAVKDLVYGTDVPNGTTELDVINGYGGCAPSGNGGDTIVGYGFDTPPAFDAAGTGGIANSTVMTMSHTATAGAYALVAINTGFGTFDVTYGDQTMLPLGLVYNNQGTSGATAFFGLPNAPGGAQTITVTLAQKAYVTGASISFTGVSNVGLVSSTFGNGTALSHAVTCGDKQVIVQAFGTHRAHMSGLTGGIEKYTGSNGPITNGANTYYYQGLSLSYATSSATFKATDSVSDDWGSIAVVLNPAGTVLLTAPGGLAGGPGGAANYNPANTNSTSTGLGPGNKQWGGRYFQGGLPTTTTDQAGNAPGGGSSGGNAANPVPLPGAPGYTSITAKQPATLSGMGGGFSGSGGAVAFDAVGTGASTTSSNTMSWTHTSGGGPNAAAVLFFGIHYSGAINTITASYGGSTFNVTLDSVVYYLASGTAFAIYALGLQGLPSGAQTVTLSLSGTALNTIAAEANTVSYQNVSGFDNFSTASGASTSLALTGIPANGVGYVAVGALSGWSTGDTVSGFNQTQRWADDTAIPFIIGDADDSAPVSFAASQARAVNWGAVGGILIPT